MQHCPTGEDNAAFLLGNWIEDHRHREGAERKKKTLGRTNKKEINTLFTATVTESATGQALAAVDDGHRDTMAFDEWMSGIVRHRRLSHAFNRLWCLFAARVRIDVSTPFATDYRQILLLGAFRVLVKWLYDDPYDRLDMARWCELNAYLPVEYALTASQWARVELQLLEALEWRPFACLLPTAVQ